MHDKTAIGVRVVAVIVVLPGVGIVKVLAQRLRHCHAPHAEQVSTADSAFATPRSTLAKGAEVRAAVHELLTLDRRAASRARKIFLPVGRQ